MEDALEGYRVLEEDERVISADIRHETDSGSVGALPNSPRMS